MGIYNSSPDDLFISVNQNYTQTDDEAEEDSAHQECSAQTLPQGQLSGRRHRRCCRANRPVRSQFFAGRHCTTSEKAQNLPSAKKLHSQAEGCATAMRSSHTK